MKTMKSLDEIIDELERVREDLEDSHVCLDLFGIPRRSPEGEDLNLVVRIEMMRDKYLDRKSVV